MRRLRALPAAAASAGVDRFGVQTERDRDRLLALGVPAERVAVTGNLKYESPEPPSRPGARGAAARALAAGRPILLAGSTMAGEEEQVLDAFAAPRARARRCWSWRRATPSASRGRRLLAVARPDRRRGGAALDAGGRAAAVVVLLDSLGELAGLYRLAAAAFVGGTLVPTGGHNPLEPARFGVPIAVGPSMHNFREMAEQFDRAAAWRAGRATPRRSAAAWRDGSSDPRGRGELGRARPRGCSPPNRGALERTLALLAPLLDAAARRLAGDASRAPR